MKLYFVRHGQTDANVAMNNGQLIGEYDEPLNVIGIKQAEDLAEQLKDSKFDAIISSPLLRAKQTAEIVNKYHDLPIVFDAAWRERQADTYIDPESWNDLFDFDKNIQVANSESLGDFFDRIYVALDKLKNEYANSTILVVSHGGVHHALYAYVNKLPHTGNVRISRVQNCEYRMYDL